MSARYLVRFDDICPSMDWAIWSRVERILVEHEIRPLLAVVPDNRDASLAVGPARVDFWDYIRNCQARGWTIAMHGWQHRYESTDPGLLRVNRHSEFSGLAYEAQRAKIAAAASIFAQHGVRVDAWIAPGHNFDAVTLQVLREHGIDVISDGFYFRPIRQMGQTWLPQQLWRFRAMPFGLWTVCLHHNTFTEKDLHALERTVQRFQPAIIDLPRALASFALREPSGLDRAFAALWRKTLMCRIYWSSLRNASKPPQAAGQASDNMR